MYVFWVFIKLIHGLVDLCHSNDVHIYSGLRGEVMYESYPVVMYERLRLYPGNLDSLSCSPIVLHVPVDSNAGPLKLRTLYS